MDSEQTKHGAVLLRLINYLDQDLGFTFGPAKRTVPKNDIKRAPPSNWRTKGRDNEEIRAAKSARNRFASYLVSIVTHPIGLRASLSPYNCSVERMLAYLMNMLRFTENQLRRILVTGPGHDTHQLLRDQENDPDDDTKSPAGLAVFKKFHVWKPELRIRINPPAHLFQLNGNARGPANSLLVRIFLFKIKDQAKRQIVAEQQQQQLHDGPKHELGHDVPSASPKSADSLLELLKNSQKNPLSQPRPQKDLRAEIRLVKRSVDGHDSFKVVQILGNQVVASRNASKIKTIEGDTPRSTYEDEDIRLNIRRYYCEPDAFYILKLEFCLERYSSGLNSFSSSVGSFCRRLARVSCCLANGGGEENSPQQIKKLHNLGFTSLRLSQIPSYASKSSHPVWSASDKRIGSCELSLEFRNRHLSAAAVTENNATHNEANGQLDTDRIRQEFITNHVRLYAICIAHQMASLINDDQLDLSSTLEHSHSTAPTLDDLLYLPAFSIINQHRLQSNLSQQEDQSLRRSALLLLLIRLDQNPPPGRSEPELDLCKLLLISIAQHEFLGANRHFNNSTRQDTSLFQSRPVDRSRDITTILEHETIQGLEQNFVSAAKLNIWLTAGVDQSSEISGESCNKKLVMLASLRLVRNIITHYENNPLASPRLVILAGNIELKLTQILSSTLMRQIKSRINVILSDGNRESNSPCTPPDSSTVQSNLKTKHLSHEALNPWLRLLSDIQIMENDIMLHWSEKGLESLNIAQIEMFDEQEEDQKDRIKSVIENKMKNYLSASKG